MRHASVVLAAIVVFAGSACGGGGSTGSAAEFCSVSADLNASDAEPTEEDVDRFVDAAPPEIKDDVKALAGALKEAQDDPANAVAAFTKVQAASERVIKFQSDNCGTTTTAVPPVTVTQETTNPAG